MPTRQGSFRLFRFAGIDVFLHWSWFLVAWIALQNRADQYSSYTWNVLEYLALFAIVTLHEFGHALACRQVGGQASQIVLWPLGGVAYVSPPPRPGPILWSIAAGPLVNVFLVPVTLGLVLLSQGSGWDQAVPDLGVFFRVLMYINAALLIFNLLPIYPLDGGQILRALLWFLIGPGRSLMAASVVGFAGVAALIGLAVLVRSVWLGIVAGFILINCWRGLLQARALARVADAERHSGFACPACQTAPPAGAFWICARCQTRFDTFSTGATCPNCGAQFAVTPCPGCGQARPFNDWVIDPSIPPRLPR